MKIILLCGGSGVRIDNILPKPLNLIHGVPLIQLCIESLVGLSELIIFYNPILDEYGFREFCINQFPKISFMFYKTPFPTRGPVETMYLCLKSWDLAGDNPIIFLDNDNIYDGFDFETVARFQTPCVFYARNKTGLSHYSFLKIDKNAHHVLDIKERLPISDDICVGGYGFANIQQALYYCRTVISDCSDSEPFVSFVIQKMLQEHITVFAHEFEACFSVGTPNDAIHNSDKIPRKQLRIVFDLDNTIVTYPRKYKDYSTVGLYKNIVDFIRELKKQDHYIIIHTARKMVSANHSIEIAKTMIGDSIESFLNEHNIPFDEIILGKPFGDIYIDDKAYNPFDHSLFSQIGFYRQPQRMRLKGNRYHEFHRVNKTTINKCGQGLEGEAYFYNAISNHTVRNLFPTFRQYISNTSISLEYIHGIPLNDLYSHELLQQHLFRKLMKTVKELHSADIDDGSIITHEKLRHHFLNKFLERSKKQSDYILLEGFSDIFRRLNHWLLDDFLKHAPRRHAINHIIHGDLWFSNIIYSDKRFVFIDMRGRVDDVLSIKGYVIYDYAKLYQSIIGLDYIIANGRHIPNHVREPIEQEFWEIYEYDPTELRMMTAYMIFNTFHAYDTDVSIDNRQLIWELISRLISEDH